MRVPRLGIFEKDSSNNDSQGIHVLDEGREQRHDVKLFTFIDRDAVEVELFSADLFGPTLKVATLISEDDVGVWLYFFDDSGQVEGVEIVHDPAVPDYDFLKMELAVVGIEFELIATDRFFIGVSLEKVK